MTDIEYVHVGRHADVLQSGVGIGPGDRITSKDLGDEDQHLLDEEVLVDVTSFGSGPSNKPSKAKTKAPGPEGA